MAESTTGGLIALGILALAIYSCSNDQPKNAVATSTVAGDSYAFGDSGNEGIEESDERGSFDENAAREAAESELASSSYVSEGSTYGCRDDCSGHEAGWRWRAEWGYQGHNADSPSFEEGGRAFDDAVDEKVEEARDAHDRGEDPDY